MRMLMRVIMPNEPFNTMVREGNAAAQMRRVLDEIRPEAAYFTAQDGCRCGTLIVDLPETSAIPRIAEGWFLLFNAKIEMFPVMVPEDLAKSGLDRMATKWA